ncbi:hypothetical protein [Nitriliruptor alkaliphilus]|uniref:hypothetical protein n=1 Tax=Nitriliruptor alkaliphilus TaxID=427918 RepID=UPI0006991AE7|nr:hypothetical protein [Nitriliruptor alkaliphilus]
MEPTVERFRGLARSSPWRWSTLRYTEQRPDWHPDGSPLRVLVRRPKLARIERLDGTLVRILREEPRTVTPLSRGGDAGPVELPGSSSASVEFDADGLVRRRPDRWETDTDTAMIGNYYDVATLDPVELADGHDGGPGATIDDLRAVEHHGRETWEAILRPTAVYEPRCTCCSLLLSELIEDAGFEPRAEDRSFTYPDAQRIRLDVGTGVCVANEQLGGSRAGTGHDIAIEAVDEPMADDLFPPPTPSRWSRLLGGP